MTTDITCDLTAHLPAGMTRTGWVRHLPEIAPSVSDRILALERAAVEKYVAAEAAMRQARAEFAAALVEADAVAKKHWKAAEIGRAQTRHVADGDDESVCRWCGGDAMVCYPRFLAGRSCA